MRGITIQDIVLHINCHHICQCVFMLWAQTSEPPESDAGCTSGHQAISAVSIRNWVAKRSSWKENLVNKIIHAEVSSFVCYCWWRRQSMKCETWDMQNKSSVVHIIYCLLEEQKWNTGSACLPDGSPLTHEILFIKNNLCFSFLLPRVPHTWFKIPSPDKQNLLPPLWLCHIFLEHPGHPYTLYNLVHWTIYSNEDLICPTLNMLHTLDGVE